MLVGFGPFLLSSTIIHVQLFQRSNDSHQLLARICCFCWRSKMKSIKPELKWMAKFTARFCVRRSIEIHGQWLATLCSLSSESLEWFCCIHSSDGIIVEKDTGNLFSVCFRCKFFREFFMDNNYWKTSGSLAKDLLYGRPPSRVLRILDDDWVLCCAPSQLIGILHETKSNTNLLNWTHLTKTLWAYGKFNWKQSFFCRNHQMAISVYVVVVWVCTCVCFCVLYNVLQPILT